MHNSPVSTNDSKTWQPRDTFAWLQDGISNQIMIGEKHIPPNRLGKGKKENDNGQASNDPDMLDCSYMNTGLSRTVSSARAIRRHAAATTNDTDLTNWGDVNGIHRVDEKTADNVHQQDIGFGSYHPGSSNILFGDGTVHSMPPTTHTRIVGALSFVFDGNSVQIP
jgi:prepilin-type processing-associated H-X9-DG protein